MNILFCAITIIVSILYLTHICNGVLYYDKDSVYIDSNVNILGDLTIRGGFFAKNLELLLWRTETHKNAIAMMHRILRFSTTVEIASAPEILYPAVFYINKDNQPMLHTSSLDGDNDYRFNLATKEYSEADTFFKSYFSEGFGTPHKYTFSKSFFIVYAPFRLNLDNSYHLYSFSLLSWHPLDPLPKKDNTEYLSIFADENTFSILLRSESGFPNLFHQYRVVENSGSFTLTEIQTLELPADGKTWSIGSIYDNPIFFNFVAEPSFILVDGVRNNFTLSALGSENFIQSLENRVLLTMRGFHSVLTFSSLSPVMFDQITTTPPDPLLSRYMFGFFTSTTTAIIYHGLFLFMYSI